MAEKSDLPSCQKCYRESQKAPCIGFVNKKQRREYHSVVPVVNATSGTTFVFEKPRLERAEKQDADHVAHRIGGAQQNHDAVIEDAYRVQSTKYQV